MKFNFTKEKLSKILVGNVELNDWFDAFNEILPKYEINTVERVAGFLAQTCHESANYTKLEENLNYSAERLVAVFPKRFPSLSAARPFHRKPQMIANRIYSNRMGNGSPESNDGWNFRGRGPIQITGKYNYTECSKYLFKDLRLIKTPELILLDKKICVGSAVWYWNSRNLNKFADSKNIVGMTRAINGGTIGLEDRDKKFKKFLIILV